MERNTLTIGFDNYTTKLFNYILNKMEAFCVDGWLSLTST